MDTLQLTSLCKTVADPAFLKGGGRQEEILRKELYERAPVCRSATVKYFTA